MSAASTRRKLIWAAATDRTFERLEVDGRLALAGKCIHCSRRIVVSLDEAPSSATLEHILPKNHGGTDALDNIALACRGCNNGKGTRLDHRPISDPKLQEVIRTLRSRRRKRRRAPPDDWTLPELPHDDE